MYGYLSIMRAVIQRVSQASVMIENHKTQSISKGAVILLGIGVHDTSEDVINYLHLLENVLKNSCVFFGKAFFGQSIATEIACRINGDA